MQRVVILFFIILLLSVIFFPNVVALAQFFSFEIYELGGRAYPTVEEVHTIKNENSVTITANIHDVSGVLSTTLYVEDPDSNNYIGGAHLMQNIGGEVYSTTIDVSTFNFSEKDYYFDIFVTDMLINSGRYKKLGPISEEQISNIVCSEKNGAQVCVSTSENIVFSGNCDIKNGAVICVNVLEQIQ